MTQCSLGGDENNSGILVKDSNWHHIVATFDNSTFKSNIYLDSKMISEKTHAGSVNSTDLMPIVLGASTYIATTPFLSGNLDDVRFYRNILTTKEVGKIYANRYMNINLVSK